MTLAKIISIRPAQAAGAGTQRVEPFVPLVIAETEGKREALVERFHSDTRGLREAINRIDARIAAVVQGWNALHAERRALGFEDFRPKFAPWLYWLIIGIAAVLEIPLNESALAMLRMGEWETFSTAAFVALLNTVGASLFGSRLRQIGWGRPFAADWVMLAVVAAVAGLAMLGITELRSAFTAFERGPEAARMGWLGFTAMQALFFAVAVFMSFCMHHHDPKIEQVLRDEGMCRRHLDALLGEREPIAAKFNWILGQTEARLRQTEAKALRLIAEERYENGRARQTPAPSYFQQVVPFNAFRPIVLGRPVDPHPARLDQLLDSTEDSQ